MAVSRCNKETWLLLRRAKLSVNRCSRKVTDGGWWGTVVRGEWNRSLLHLDRKAYSKGYSAAIVIACWRILTSVFFSPHINLPINHHAIIRTNCERSLRLIYLEIANPLPFFFIQKYANTRRRALFIHSLTQTTLFLIFNSVYLSLYTFTKDRPWYIKTCTVCSIALGGSIFSADL